LSQLPGRIYLLSGITALTAEDAAFTPVAATETPVETTSAVIDTAASATAKTEHATIFMRSTVRTIKRNTW